MKENRAEPQGGQRNDYPPSARTYRQGALVGWSAIVGKKGWSRGEEARGIYWGKMTKRGHCWSDQARKYQKATLGNETSSRGELSVICQDYPLVSFYNQCFTKVYLGYTIYNNYDIQYTYVIIGYQ